MCTYAGTYQSNGWMRISMKGRNVLRLPNSTSFCVTNQNTRHHSEWGRLAACVSSRSENDSSTNNNANDTYLEGEAATTQYNNQRGCE